MKKAYTYCFLSALVLLIGIIFTISGFILQILPFSSKSALLIFSCAFIIIGTVLFAVHHKRYITIKTLFTGNTPTISRWIYPVNSSETVCNFIKEEKNYSLATTTLILILSIIFSLIFAYSGGLYVLYLGYTFGVLSLLVFIIALRFIAAYYNALSQTENCVIFTEDYIYFIDELNYLTRSFHTLEDINIYIGKENLLIFKYGLDDLDDSSSYTITIPIPPDKLNIALYLKNYYRSTLLQSDDSNHSI